jgi:outer membrane cobalamin receptor
MHIALVRRGWMLVAGALVPLRVATAAPLPQDTARADTGRTRQLSPIVVTGTRVPVSRDALGFATSALEAASLRREPAQWAPTVLSRLPSVAIEEGAGVAGPTILRLRGGEESFSVVMFDGVPLNLTGGFADLQGLTLTNVERVEIARGPQSVLYGSSAMAGAVQFITREGRPGRPQVEVAAEGGTSATRGGQARTEVTVSGGTPALRYSAGASGGYFRGIYALPHNLTTWDGSLRLDASLGRHWDLTGTVRYMDHSSLLPVRDAGVSRVPLDPNQEDGRGRLLSGVTARFAPTAAWRHQLSARVLRDAFFYQCYADGLDPAAYPFPVFDYNFRLDADLWRGTLEYAGTNDLSGGRGGVLLAYGGKFEREDLGVAQGGDFGDSRAGFARDNGAGFLEVQGRAGRRLDFLGGVRYERFEGLGDEILPRASLVVTLVPDVLRLRAAAGRAFKAPNLEQQNLDNPFTAPNPDLRPETSVSWEAGLVATLPRAAVSARASFFHQVYDDLIRLVPFDETRAQNRNVGKSRIRGVELEVDRAWGPGWRTGLNGTWLDSRMVDNTGLDGNLYPVGSRLFGVPRWTGNAFVEGDLTAAISVALRGRLVGQQEILTERFSGERVELDPYFLLGATVHARLRPGIQAYVRAENLLDAEYDTAYDRPGLPLTAIVGLRVTR